MSAIVVEAGGPLVGEARVPGDKSISHRAVLLGALAAGESRVRGFLDGADCRATVGAMRELGVRVDAVSPTELRVHGLGLRGLRPPRRVLDCHNSGTTLRLLVGLLAGQPFASVLVGTDQLQGRPMGRVVAPLRRMGARITGREGGALAPLTVTPRDLPLRGVEHRLAVASAQVKSCLLLAGLQADGVTATVEPAPCRDHTERMLRAMGAPLGVEGPRVEVRRPAEPLAPLDLVVPGDVSSAAFLLVAGAIVPGSRLTLPGVGVNPTRAGVVEVLRRMGATLTVEDAEEVGGEPTATLTIAASDLVATAIGGAEIGTLIDEVPVLAVAATQAVGETVVRDASELRVKETDRIETTCAELRRLGADVEPLPDGLGVRGPTPLVGAEVDAHGDHRLAMALTVAGLIAQGTTTVRGVEVVGDSFPGFFELVRGLGARVVEA